MKDNMIVAGDMNAHSKEWDNHWKKSRVRSEGVERIQTLELEIQNNPNQITRWKPGGTEEYVIDLTLAMGEVEMEEWTTCREENSG
jgi:hypothetical protein